MRDLMRCADPLRTGLGAAALVVLALLCAPPALAHKASDAYVQLDATVSAVKLRVDIALRDLDPVLDLDTDGDGQLTWAEVRAAWPAIEGFVASHLQVQGCPLGAPQRSLERRADGVYAALSYSAPCALEREPIIRYTAFAAEDPTHRAIARVTLHGRDTLVRVLDPRQNNAALARQGAPAESTGGPPSATVAQTAAATVAATVVDLPAGFLGEGVHHIVTGYDHVLFLLCLLFPAVMRRTPQGWRPLGSLREALWPVIGIVTAFTVAHSITLALAALKWVALPSSFIEPAIAVTIILAALNNIWPIFHGRVVLVTFGFGLLHGFGFAGVLSELNLPTMQFALALLQFNVGLELGQVMIVMVAVSLMFVARNSARYVALVIRGGSLAAMLIALVWFIERTADVSLMAL